MTHNTHSFELSPWKIADAPQLSKVANDSRISQFMTDAFPNPYTLEHAMAFIEMTSKNKTSIIRAIRIEGLAVGGIGLHLQSDIFRQNAELGYWIGVDYQGKGIVTAAIREMLHIGFAVPDIQRIFARPFSNNPASKRILEKNGFTQEACLKGTILKAEKNLDEFIYSIRKTSWQKNRLPYSNSSDL